MYLQNFSDVLDAVDIKNVYGGNTDITNSSEIYLYTVSLNSLQHNIPNLISYLTQEEKEQANSYYTKELSEHYIISHSILRQVLSRHTTVHPRKIQFTLGPYAKPYLQNNQNNIQFNMSHSKGMLCIAVTKDDEVGVDIEFKDNKTNVEELRNLVLSMQELEYINSLASYAKQRDFFYDIWTLKEAIVKATGQGLSYPITQINLIDNALDGKTAGVIKVTASLAEYVQERKLYLTSSMVSNTPLNIDTDYSCAIASKSVPKQIIHLELEQEGKLKLDDVTHNQHNPKFHTSTNTQEQHTRD